MEKDNEPPRLADVTGLGAVTRWAEGHYRNPTRNPVTAAELMSAMQDAINTFNHQPRWHRTDLASILQQTWLRLEQEKRTTRMTMREQQLHPPRNG